MQIIQLFCCVCLATFVDTSKSSIKWNVMKKYIKIGDEVVLSCNFNDCLPNMRKSWYGGRGYDLLCYNDISTNPSKYKMKSYKSSLNSELIIKQFNFTDLNCVYTCACGFNRYTQLFQLGDLDFVYGDIKNESKLEDDRFIIEVTMKVYPIPKCFIFYKAKVFKTSVKIAEFVKPNGNVPELYTVTIKASLNVEPSDFKVSINVKCQVQPPKYHHILDINTRKEFVNVRSVSATFIWFALSIGIICFIVLVSLLVTQMNNYASCCTAYRLADQ